MKRSKKEMEMIIKIQDEYIEMQKEINDDLKSKLSCYEKAFT